MHHAYGYEKYNNIANNIFRRSFKWSMAYR